MNEDADIARVASLIGDPARAGMLVALLDGRVRPASELAVLGRVSRATASVHLAKLVDAGLLVAERHGRHRYFRLDGPEVAAALEALAVIAPPVPVRSLRAAQEGEAIRFARLCYDHLAGRVGVAVAERMLQMELLRQRDGVLDVTPRGEEWLGRFGVDVAALRRQRRRFAFACLDWSERTHHVAGALGAALAARFLELGWVRRSPRSRAIQLTDAGRRGLAEVFGLELERVEREVAR